MAFSTRAVLKIVKEVESLYFTSAGINIVEKNAEPEKKKKIWAPNSQ